jgi:hypothetical protein
MYRVCVHASTENLLEMQSGGYTEDVELNTVRLNTLRQNALDAGYFESDFEVKWVTEEEWATIQEKNKPVLTYADLRRAEYPSQFDYLDGIVKNDLTQIQKYVNDCLAVKAKYPK